MSSKVDVVIPVRNEFTKLEFCCKSALRRIPINNLIIVVSPSKDRTLQVAKKYGNIVFMDDNQGVGHARSLGLEKVETEYYVSLDADIIIPKNWYSMCSESIRGERVAACQGYDRPLEIGRAHV
jgi:glycosyltransferase involved in cell wall biosynthesis